MDVAADKNNAVVPRYGYAITREMDALGEEPWGPAARAWCNPPFTLLRQFVRRAIHEVEFGNLGALGLVTLADTSTRYWRELESLQHGQSVVSYRVPIVGRWSCEPPPGISVSSPRAAMALWILRRPAIPPKRYKR